LSFCALCGSEGDWDCCDFDVFPEPQQEDDDPCDWPGMADPCECWNDCETPDPFDDSNTDSDEGEEEEDAERDCNGILGGSAYEDLCGECVGGNTGKVPCKQDCAGVFGGSAYIDECGNCVGGNTGEEACEQDCLDFSKLVNEVLNFEGGFVDDPVDPGGATNRGITWNTWQNSAQIVLGVSPTLENLKDLSETEAAAIYKALYWDKIRADDITDGDVRFLLFDFYVNAGGNAVKVLQRTLRQLDMDISVDGAIGSITIDAINSADAIQLYNNFKENRINYYTSIVEKNPNLNKFLNGWKNRTNKFKDKTTENNKDVNCK